MKRIKKLLAVMAAVFVLITTLTAVADDISVVLNGEKVTFNNAKPVIYNDTTLIPVRSVFEKLNWTVDWDSESRMAIIGNEEKVLFITIDKNYMEVYDINTDTQEKISLNVSARIIDSSTMLPLRAVCEALGASVDWNGNTRTVYIDKE